MSKVVLKKVKLTSRTKIGYLKFWELVGLEISGKDEPDDMLRQEGERAQVEDLVAVLVNKVENLRKEHEKWFSTNLLWKIETRNLEGENFPNIFNYHNTG